MHWAATLYLARNRGYDRLMKQFTVTFSDGTEQGYQGEYGISGGVLTITQRLTKAPGQEAIDTKILSPHAWVELRETTTVAVDDRPIIAGPSRAAGVVPSTSPAGASGMHGPGRY
jgi:hypothetical protein